MDENGLGVLVGAGANIVRFTLALGDDLLRTQLGDAGQLTFLDQEGGLLLGAGEDALGLFVSALDDALGFGPGGRDQLGRADPDSGVSGPLWRLSDIVADTYDRPHGESPPPVQNPRS